MLGKGLPIPGIDFFEDFPFANPGGCQFRASEFFPSASGRTQNLAPYYQLLGPIAVSHSHPACGGLLIMNKVMGLTS